MEAVTVRVMGGWVVGVSAAAEPRVYKANIEARSINHRYVGFIYFVLCRHSKFMVDTILPIITIWSFS